MSSSGPGRGPRDAGGLDSSAATARERSRRATLVRRLGFGRFASAVRRSSEAASSQKSDRRTARSGAPGCGIVLGYHHVARLMPDPFGLCVPPELFGEHLDYLRRAWRPMPLEELVAGALRGAVPDRAVAVTLDDGALDALSTAVPALEATGIPATFFVMSGALDRSSEPWWHSFDRVFAAAPDLPSALAVRVAGEMIHLPTNNAREAESAQQRLYPVVTRLPPGERDALVSELLAWSRSEAAVRDSHRTMTGDELRRLASRPGMAIGAHSVNHASLPALAPAERRDEIQGSRKALEARLGQPIHLFCYPYGHFDESTVDDVRTAGFVAATTCQAGVVTPGFDPFRTPRLIVPPISRQQLEGVMEALYRSGE